MKQNEKIFQAKNIKILIRVLVVLIPILLMLKAPLSVTAQSPDTINFSDLVPKPNESSGAEFFTTVGRGIYNMYIPDQGENFSLKYNKWTTMDDIANGLDVLDTIMQLENGTPHLLSDFLTNYTVNKLVQTVFSERSNNTDLWWAVT